MTNEEKNHQAPACPSCGQPVTFDFLRFKIGDKVKILLVVLMIGYFILSLLILTVISPTGLGRACRRYDYIHQPDYCKDTEFNLWVRPLNNEPALQVFVGVGLAMGVLALYWDWLQKMYKNWQRKREKPVQKRGKIYKYKCRYCGRQWN